jgi:hypothetical protein
MGNTCNFGFTFPKNSLNCDSTGLLVAEQASAHELEREHLVGNFFPRRPIWAIEVRRFGRKIQHQGRGFKRDVAGRSFEGRRRLEVQG